MMNPYIEYINVLLHNSQKSSKISDLIDCFLIRQVLIKIPQFPIPSLHLSSKNFTQLFSNLKQTYKALEQFRSRNLSHIPTKSHIDLVSIAYHKNQQEMQKIIRLFIQSVVISSQKSYFISKILETSEGTQKYFMSIVGQTMIEPIQSSEQVHRQKQQQNLYDKIIELGNQNESLQHVIDEICCQREQLHYKCNQLTSKLGDISHQYYNSIHNTSYRNNINQYREQLIIKHNEELSKLNTSYNNQTFKYIQQINALTQELQSRQQLIYENQQLKQEKTALSVSVLDSREQYNKLFQLHQLKENEHQAILNLLQSKEYYLRQLQQKNNVKDKKIEKMKNQIDDLNHKIAHSNHTEFSEDEHNLRDRLSENCPDMQSNQLEIVYESNQKLTDQLERYRFLLKQKQDRILKLLKQQTRCQNLEIQNKKLVQIIKRNKETHEDEKYLLLGCLYQIKKKYSQISLTKNNKFPPNTQKQDLKPVTFPLNEQYQNRLGLKRGLKIMQNNIKTNYE